MQKVLWRDKGDMTTHTLFWCLVPKKRRQLSRLTGVFGDDAFEDLLLARLHVRYFKSN